MLFLSPGIVYWLQMPLHWLDNNTVFIVGVSRVHSNSLPQKIGKKQNQIVYTHCIYENIRSVHEQKDKNCSKNKNILNDRPRFYNSSIFVVKLVFQFSFFFLAPIKFSKNYVAQYLFA